MLCPGFSSEISCLHPPSSACMLYRALQGLLCGTCRHTGAISRYRGFALCQVTLAPSTRNTSALVTQESTESFSRTPANPGAVCRAGEQTGLGNAQQAGHKAVQKL